ncbi:type II toxin-antitoxin system VapC family toxin [Planctomycetota bacterium]
MSRVFVDTSALLAFLVPTDASHQESLQAFGRLQAREAALVTTSYVLCETYALLSRRFGLDKVRAFREGLEALLDCVWVDQELHQKGLDLLLAQSRPGLSLVDAVSFATMRGHRLDEAFAYDRHFEREGFRCL